MTLDIYIDEFADWITDNSSFNSFIIPENELASIISENSSSSNCIRLYSKINETNEKYLYTTCDMDNPKCRGSSNVLQRLQTIAPPNVCTLIGNFKNITIILEHDAFEQYFIYVLVQGCYHISNFSNNITNYIWSFTNNTYLKYSIDDIYKKNISKNISVKFIDEIKFSLEGSSCLNLCTASFCSESTKIWIPIIITDTDVKSLKTAEGSLVQSLSVFGILAAIFISIAGLTYIIYKYYNKG